MSLSITPTTASKWIKHYVVAETMSTITAENEVALANWPLIMEVS